MHPASLICALGSLTLAATTARAQEAPRLGMPLACEPGQTCFIQHYVDIDVGPDVRDFRCGTATYEGHKGVDFRVLSAAAAKKGVSVLATAPGTVKGMRDGMADAFARETGKVGITDRECGNGVVIDHGGGWETQYCHLRQGSVTAKRGDRVQRGQKLGDVGWSGLADFAHLHLSVRKDGNVIDPFTGAGQTGACMLERQPAGIWMEDVIRGFPYRNGEILDVAFAEREPALAALEHDHAALRRPGATSPAMLVYARIIHVRAGDQIRLSIDGPGGFSAQSSAQPIDKSRPLQIMYTGRKLSVGSWPRGRYVGRAELFRAGAVISSRETWLDID